MSRLALPHLKDSGPAFFRSNHVATVGCIRRSRHSRNRGLAPDSVLVHVLYACSESAPRVEKRDNASFAR